MAAKQIERRIKKRGHTGYSSDSSSGSSLTSAPTKISLWYLMVRSTVDKIEEPIKRSANEQRRKRRKREKKKGDLRSRSGKGKGGKGSW